MKSIYRSTVLGDEGTAPVEVKRLPKQIEKLRGDILFAQEGVIEMENNLATAKQILSDLVKQCNHHYFIDDHGTFDTSRRCAICDAWIGYI